MEATPQLGPKTRMSAVRLRVADLDGVGAFYREAVGLREVEANAPGADLALGVDGEALVELVGDPSAPPRPARTTGLFHLALLVPGRPGLAAAVKRVGDAGHRFTGASDHLVSEALYLDDPEGNGIEIYRDRDRSEWQRDPDGSVRMATLPLDLPAIMAEAPERSEDGMPPGTRMGHVHLNVADLGNAEAFYCDRLGFDVMVRWPPSALFVAAGGYHHHLGLNTWRGEGAPSPPEGSRGLISFEIAGDAGESAETVDPFGIRVVLKAL